MMFYESSYMSTLQLHEPIDRNFYRVRSKKKNQTQMHRY